MQKISVRIRVEGRMITELMKGLGSEYNDEVTKSNKKEDMMLERKIK